MEFRTIPSLFNKYEVNEDGTIFRNAKTKKELTIKLDMHHSQKGYYTTFVHFGGRQPDNYNKRVMIHRVVAECWLGPCPDGYEVDHIDRNSHNNDYHNLRYVTRSEQMKNRDHSGIGARGTRNCKEARRKRARRTQLFFDNNESYIFDSISEAAAFLASRESIKVDKARQMIKHKNKMPIPQRTRKNGCDYSFSVIISDLSNGEIEAIEERNI